MFVAPGTLCLDAGVSLRLNFTLMTLLCCLGGLNPARCATSGTLPLGGLFQLDGPRPIQAEIEHDVSFQLGTGRFQLRRVLVDAPHARVALFGGVAQARTFVRVLDNRTTDVVASLTLTGIHVRELMSALKLPRAGELEGTAGGRVELEMHGGVFTQADLRLEVEENTAYISRGLLAQLLGFQLNEDLLTQFNKTMNENFGTSQMLPLAGLTMTGGLKQQLLRLEVPIRNKALDVTLEPRIEGPLLWDFWKYVQREVERAAHERQAAH